MMSQEAEECLKLAESYVKDVDEAGEIEQDEVAAGNLLNTLDLAMKQIEKAEQIDPAAELDGLDIAYFKADVYGLKGMVKNIGLGKRSAAISDLNKSIELCDDIALTHFSLGYVYQEMGRKEEAVKHLKKAVELDPESMEFRKALDRVESASGVGMKVGAFHGSWKVVLVLAGLTIATALGALSGAEGAPSLMVFALICGAILFVYWKVKSK